MLIANMAGTGDDNVLNQEEGNGVPQIQLQAQEEVIDLEDCGRVFYYRFRIE